MMPSASAAGTPMSHSPAVATLPTKSMASAVPFIHCTMATPAFGSTSPARRRRLRGTAR
jgi:hypothetical protein